MKFTAYKYKIIRYKASITKLLFWAGLLFFSIGFFLFFLNYKMPLVDDISNIVLSFILLGSIPFISSHIYQYFDYERIVFKKDGHLEINEEAIVINHSLNILYHEIKDIKFGIVAYYGQRINMFYKNPVEQKSLGIKNYISIATDSDIYKYNFKLESEVQFKELEQTIFELVQSEKLDHIDSKRRIKLVPARFKKTGEYKKFVIKQIVEKRIGCTEGLLLHGYNTDDEAFELRKKYCG
ncbi:hypothetical protein BUL40_12570 [Croceivirga radicis]|uniref:Uncharacterized protein n=1 Tax=Croceivirga radicis TaxID=1929488 RepID=A0A1V6LP25_9FLAO|nr:hypothetical protein [Croceivirga radicis]OQD41944.1 hypothetical protein BUL40_12570 [Croceivirga radicis]